MKRARSVYRGRKGRLESTPLRQVGDKGGIATNTNIAADSVGDVYARAPCLPRPRGTSRIDPSATGRPFWREGDRHDHHDRGRRRDRQRAPSAPFERSRPRPKELRAQVYSGATNTNVFCNAPCNVTIEVRPGVLCFPCSRVVRQRSRRAGRRFCDSPGGNEVQRCRARYF